MEDQHQHIIICEDHLLNPIHSFNWLRDITIIYCHQILKMEIQFHTHLESYKFNQSVILPKHKLPTESISATCVDKVSIDTKMGDSIWTMDTTQSLVRVATLGNEVIKVDRSSSITTEDNGVTARSRKMSGDCSQPAML